MDNTGYTPEEPIAAIATALVPAALGIIRVSGKSCRKLLSSIFSRPKALLAALPNSIVYGWIVDPSNGEKVDEVLVSVFCAPKSFTGEDMAEISCHGGVSVVTAIYALLLKHGFRPAERGEFTFRAYINGKTDLTRAEAVREIIDSKTAGSRSRAAGRLAGNLYDVIDSIKKSIVDTIADIEVEIEYPEDEETIADTFDPSKLKEAERRLSQLADSWTSEKIYQDGARVVLCGRTNAGKSSLFNSLLKEERAIVSNIEGTTRDFIESWVDFDGIPARLFDTAGLRDTEDVIEQRGVERTKDLSREADLILYMVDMSAGITDDDREFIKANSSKIPLILVLNKSDKLGGTDFSLETELESAVSSVVKISAKLGSQLDSLSSVVKSLLLKGSKTEREQAGLGSERQKNAVEQALLCVRHALSLSADYALDAVVQDLEDSLDFLGAVTGDVTPDDILGSIFSRFCVGK